VKRRAKNRHHPADEHQKATTRERSRCRARGKHAFHVLKKLWGCAKVRYRGRMKNTSRALSTFALANLFLKRKKLTAVQPSGARSVIFERPKRAPRPTGPNRTRPPGFDLGPLSHIHYAERIQGRFCRASPGVWAAEAACRVSA